MEDHQIIDLFWGRDQRAITETASKYGTYCYSIARNILSNPGDAEESVNDTYLGAWNSIPPHRPAVLRTFLGKITRRVSLNRWRDSVRDKRGGGETALALEELEDCVASGGTVEEAVQAEELGRSLNRFLDGLPETERRVFLCRYWYLDSIETISLDLGFSVSKVKSMLHRTRGRLRDHLQREGMI